MQEDERWGLPLQAPGPRRRSNESVASFNFEHNQEYLMQALPASNSRHHSLTMTWMNRFLLKLYTLLSSCNFFNVSLNSRLLFLKPFSI